MPVVSNRNLPRASPSNASLRDGVNPFHQCSLLTSKLRTGDKQFHLCNHPNRSLLSSKLRTGDKLCHLCNLLNRSLLRTGDKLCHLCNHLNSSLLSSKLRTGANCLQSLLPTSLLSNKFSLRASNLGGPRFQLPTRSNLSYRKLKLFRVRT
jgi:hypothetical protein